jgi:hypothetical protein
MAFDLEGLAGIACLDGAWRQALIYLGAAQELRHQTGAQLAPVEQADLTRIIQPALAAFPPGSAPGDPRPRPQSAPSRHASERQHSHSARAADNQPRTRPGPAALQASSHRPRGRPGALAGIRFQADRKPRPVQICRMTTVLVGLAPVPSWRPDGDGRPLRACMFARPAWSRACRHLVGGRGRSAAPEDR